jgi:hypothetical protein
MKTVSNYFRQHTLPIFLLALLAFPSLTACKSSSSDSSTDPVICGVTKPAENLAWLKTFIAGFPAGSGAEINSYQYKGQTVVVTNYPKPMIYDCKGAVLCTAGGIVFDPCYDNMSKEFTGKVLVYKQ